MNTIDATDVEAFRELDRPDADQQPASSPQATRPPRHAEPPKTLLDRVEAFISKLSVRDNFWNSVKIAIPAAIISSFIGSLNGYVFAKWRFPYSNLVFMLILAVGLDFLRNRWYADQNIGIIATSIAAAWQMAMYLAREETGASLPQIGEALGGRDHTTVMYGWEKIASNIEQDDKLRREMLAVREIIYSNVSMY